MFDDVESLECLACREVFQPAIRQACPRCGAGGRLRFHYRLDELARGLDRAELARRESWLWRYRELLPLDELADPPPLQVGMTPLYGSSRLAAYAGVRGLMVKDESRNPTGRSADRAAALLVAQACHVNASGLLSAGLALPVAAFSASAGRELAAVGSGGEVQLLLQYGARVVRTGAPLGREDLLRVAQATGRYLADLPNPLVFEGLKTLGLEIGEQLAERMPGWIAVDASLPERAEAVREGVDLFRALGFYRELPRLLAVNGEGGDAQVQAAPEACHAAALQVRRDLGLAVDAEGAAALAGLRRAVARAQVPAEATVLAIVEGPPPREDPLRLPEPEVVRGLDDAVAALRGKL